jgi:hypothetical protein
MCLPLQLDEYLWRTSEAWFWHLLLMFFQLLHVSRGERLEQSFTLSMGDTELCSLYSTRFGEIICNIGRSYINVLHAFRSPSNPLSPHEMTRTTFELLLAAPLQTPRPVVRPSSVLWNRFWSFFPWVQRPGSEVNHLPVSVAEVKDQWSYISTQLVCFLGVDRENLTSTSHLPAFPQRWGVNLFSWTVRVKWGGVVA